MLSTVYVSSATHPFSDDELAVLLMNSRANNARLGLTGMLLHHEGRFIQVLEGPDAAVESRYSVIANDPRHTDVRKLSEDTIAEREFGAWTMGYTAVTDTLAHELPGFDDFLEYGAADRPDLAGAHWARRLLEQFRDELVLRA